MHGSAPASAGRSGEVVLDLLPLRFFFISGSARCSVCESPKSASLTESGAEPASPG